jgi:hypothetical protein
MLKEFRVSVKIQASQENVWQRLVHWESQGEWMALTKVSATEKDSLDSGVGTRVVAFTGIGKLGIRDSMVVTQWQPPEFCSVLHDGRIIKGIGEFRLVKIGAEKTRFDWYEEIEAPKWILLLIKGGILLSVRYSLMKFARSFA